MCRFAARVAVAKARVAREGGGRSGCRSATGNAIFSEAHLTHVVQPCFWVVKIDSKLNLNEVLKRQYRFTMD